MGPRNRDALYLRFHEARTISSLIDLGCGPSWAAATVGP